jgi:hypothetical protein
MMNWLQIKDSWRDIELTNKRYTFHLKANADGGTVTINSGSSYSFTFAVHYAQSIVLSKDDLVELGRFLKPFVDEAENDGT